MASKDIKVTAAGALKHVTEQGRHLVEPARLCLLGQDGRPLSLCELPLVFLHTEELLDALKLVRKVTIQIAKDVSFGSLEVSDQFRVMAFDDFDEGAQANLLVLGRWHLLPEEFTELRLLGGDPVESQCQL